MNALALIKKLGIKLLGKKVNTPATDEYGGGLANITLAPEDKKAPLVLDGLGIIKLHENWRN
jgi:hypothetical protein